MYKDYFPRRCDGNFWNATNGGKRGCEAPPLLGVIPKPFEILGDDRHLSRHAADHPDAGESLEAEVRELLRESRLRFLVTLFETSRSKILLRTDSSPGRARYCVLPIFSIVIMKPNEARMSLVKKRTAGMAHETS